MKKLILISGKARSGKDSFTKVLMDNLDDAQWLDMTEDLKIKVAEMLGISMTQLERFKDEPVNETIFIDDGGVFSGFKTIRHFLQFLGNEIAPTLLGKYHWCLLRQEKMFSVDHKVNILSGIRQLKEVEYFTKMNPDKEVIVIKLERTKDGKPYSPINDSDKSHSTETEVDLIEADYTFSCENLEELTKCAKDFLTKIK